MSSTAENALRLASELRLLLPYNARILVNGATGWLGSNISSTLFSIYGSDFNKHVLLTATESKTLSLQDDIQLPVARWDQYLIREFRPNYVLQLAFVTRDFVSSNTLENYVSKNQEIINAGKWMISLPTLKGFLHTSSGAAAAPDIDDVRDNPYGYLKRMEEIEYLKACFKYKKDYLGVRVWTATGAHIKTGGFLAIEGMISEALSKGTISITSSSPVYRSYADANEILVSAFIGLLSGRQGLYDSGGSIAEIGEVASLIGALTQIQNHSITRPELTLEKTDSYCSIGISVETFLNGTQLKYSDLSAQLQATVTYLSSKKMH